MAESSEVSGGNRAEELGSLFSSLPDRPDSARVVADFVPPPRFAGKTFDDFRPQHPSQDRALSVFRNASARLQKKGLIGRIFPGGSGPRGGVYLDGGFGVGKTHLLAALWNSVPRPKSYLSFDELMYFIGVFGVDAAIRAVADHRLIAIDEWELDDPGNLKMALAFLRGVVRAGAFVVVTSNTVPLELGSGRFSQKDFLAEIEEVAAVFDVVRMEGGDFRRRRFEARPGESLYLGEELGERLLSAAGDRASAFRIDFEALKKHLAEVHPIRYRDIADRTGVLLIHDLQAIEHLPTALRWVHFVDSIYDAEVIFGVTGGIGLGRFFQEADRDGPYGKKLSRCLSRMEEMLAEALQKVAG